MYRVYIDTYNKLSRGEIPIPYVLIETHLGYRAYAEKKLGAGFDTLGVYLDGSWDLGDDDLKTLGDGTVGTIEGSARMISLSPFERALTPKKDEVLVAMEGKQMQHVSIELDNADRYFSKLIAKEPFIGRELKVYVGFEESPHAEHLSIFKGIITELSVLPILTVEADER